MQQMQRESIDLSSPIRLTSPFPFTRWRFSADGTRLRAVSPVWRHSPGGFKNTAPALSSWITNMTTTLRAAFLLILCGVILLATMTCACYANDDQDFQKMVQNNSDGRFCDNLNRMIESSYTLDRSRLIAPALTFEQDCIFEMVKRYATPYPNAGQAWSGFNSFLNRELAYVKYGQRDRSNYNHYRQSIINSIDAGLIDGGSVKNMTTILGMIGTTCGYLSGDVGAGMTYLVYHGADPDQNFSLYMVTPDGKLTPQGTPRHGFRKIVRRFYRL